MILPRLKKVTGYLLGDRQKKLREAVKSWTDEELKTTTVEDNTMLRCIMEELVGRKLFVDAHRRLTEEVEAAKYAISHEPFIPIASHYRDVQDEAGVMKLLQLMISQSIAPDISVLNTILDLYVATRRWAAACDLWQNLASYNVKPNASTVGLVLELLNASVESPEQGHERIPISLTSILRIVQQEEIELTDHAYLALLRYSVVVKNYVFAKMILPRLKNSSPSSMALILRLHSELREYSEFSDVYHLMERRYGTFIDANILKMAMRILYKQGKWHTFITMFKHQVTRHKLQLPLIDFYPFVATSLRCGNLRAAFELDQLRSNGACPDSSLSYQYLLPFLSSSYIKRLQPDLETLLQLPPLLPGAATNSTQLLTPEQVTIWNNLISKWTRSNSTTIEALEEEAVAEYRHKRAAENSLRLHKNQATFGRRSPRTNPDYPRHAPL
jgi:pentatricopeptide repeat protein